jgi:hypothetical protein
VITNCTNLLNTSTVGTSLITSLTSLLSSNITTSTTNNTTVQTTNTTVITGFAHLLRNKKRIRNHKSIFGGLTNLLNITPTVNNFDPVVSNLTNLLTNISTTPDINPLVLSGFTDLLNNNTDPSFLNGIANILNTKKYKKKKKNKKASVRKTKSHFSKKSKKYGISRHGGSHNCGDHDEHLVHYNCNHNGSHKCHTDYNGSHSHNGVKHLGSHNCQNSNFKGSYNCKKGGSHKCNKHDNILYRRKGTKTCGDCECCFISNDTKAGGGILGNGNNGGLCHVQPYWTNYNDINCKMMLYDSNNKPIPNLNYPGFDTSISLKYQTLDTWQYDQIYKFLRDLELEMNRFKTKFKPYAKFELSYDYTNNKITIKNKTGAKFGIGFDFRRDGNFVTTGSLHKVLGFEQKIYLGLTEYISDHKCLIFEHSYPDDQLLLCADLIRVDQDNDINVIPLGQPNPLTNNNMLYSVPLSKAFDFRPINGLDSFIDLSESKFMVGCDCEEFDPDKPISLNFYIRLMSGRHIKQNTQWSATLKVEYLSQRIT